MFQAEFLYLENGPFKKKRVINYTTLLWIAVKITPAYDTHQQCAADSGLLTKHSKNDLEITGTTINKIIMVSQSCIVVMKQLVLCSKLIFYISLCYRSKLNPG